MQVHETKLRGVFVIECDVFADERGAVMPAWIASELAARGLDTSIAQCNLVQNHRRGTLRGMHYQRPPLAEVKLVRAIRGAIFDVAVDLRPDSPTFRQWHGIELRADDRRMFYLPHGMAHGYQTLTDDAAVMYFVSAPYSAAHQMGVRWDDPAFAIDWPLGAPQVIHPRDAAYPDFQAAARPPAR
jgi:dTDP-4-dehydrorhamnose 3,5-epimerase